MKKILKPIHILLVEDNEGDILLTQEAFEESKIAVNISVARNGQEALNFIFKRNGFENVDKPELILLDINIPLFNGHEVLKQIKSNDKFKKIPVIMLTTSSSKSDIETAYANHSNSYVRKPIDMNEFLKTVKEIDNFWLQLSKIN